ncbi:MAG TPA: hypothetical protein VEI97_03275, partial [bacterium]|nr:hypothetical protein [bacterium]
MPRRTNILNPPARSPSDSTPVPYATLEAAARAHALRSGGAVVRGGCICAAPGDGPALARGWRGYGVRLLAEGALVEAEGGYRLADAAPAEPDFNDIPTWPGGDPPADDE